MSDTSDAMEGSRFLSVGGVPARVVARGEGDAVVVLHGWGGRVESMAPVTRCLSQGFRVVAFDLPGFGQSPPPPGVWGTPDYAAFVREALEYLKVDRAHFVGHSFGAKVSLYLAATSGDLVDRLVLVGATGLRPPPSPSMRARRALAGAARVGARLGRPGRAVKEMVYRRLGSEDYRNAGPLRPILVKVVNEDLSELLPAVRASTLLVWGVNDDATPLWVARRMESLIPDAGLVLFEGAGHFAYLDEPDRFCRIATHFLTGGSRGEA